MGRSVSYASGSTVVKYAYFEYDDEDSYFVQEAFDDTLDYLKSQLTEAFPSLSETDTWLGREDHALVENNLVYIGLSEYCGLVSVWVKPKEDDHGYTNFGVRWAQQIEDKLEKIIKNAFGYSLSKVGHMSNGEGVFSKNA